MYSRHIRRSIQKNPVENQIPLKKPFHFHVSIYHTSMSSSWVWYFKQF